MSSKQFLEKPIIRQAFQKKLGRHISIVMTCIGLGLSGGCGYPELGEPAFELAKAVDNVCNVRNPSQLPKARQIVGEHLESGAITESEHQLLSGILDKAEAGDWERASDQTRSLLESQND